ncbi:NAD(P)-dependent oxidoreductase [Magnetospira sp. QH-2]|uniref:DUF1932 domain-containing protein n=1 Tax=Magnetospira sp. (strain QH-2) TaxID=1288970 RepID=UPI0003E81063|nr:NAD(P)-dependent oxidoreductase [Magnetospira sp. QH-2]CCQ74520.1 conserved protein of unknown function, similar to 6-phosphogluconate dehydrogenase, NAD-binding [Magnetospira sp. QH-2]
MTKTATQTGKIALIGFGEVAQAFVEGWGTSVAKVAWSHDIKTSHPDAAVREGKRADFGQWGVTGCHSPAEALDGARLVFSLVTADQALAAADAAAPHMTKGTLFLDGNSCAPGTKRRAAAAVEAAGAHYVDMAIMAPVHPKLHRTPLLISGPHIKEALQALNGLEMQADVSPGPVGASSSIKMIRSVMMKGLEAVFLECVLAGRKAGVDETVLDSLDRTYPGFDFKAKAGYMLERAMTHGIRRAAEMREVARTIEELGLSNPVSQATAQWEQAIGDLAVNVEGGAYEPMADAILARLFAEENAA